MSKQVKKVGKAFKKVVKAVWKVAKPIAIAVAAYFTAGVALSFIPATAGFAASLPGFAGGGVAGLGVGAGATAGTGYFSAAAAKIGLGSGLASGALKGSAMVGAVTGVEAAGVGAVSEMYGAGAAMQAMASHTLPAGTTISGGGATVSSTGVSVAGTAAAGGGVTLAAKAGMSLSDKIMLAKIGTDVAGAAFGPTELDMLEAKAQYEQEARQGTYYGMDPDGNSVQMPSFQLFQSPGQQQQPSPGTSPASPPPQQEMVTNNQPPPSGGLGPLPSPGSPGTPAQPGVNQGAAEDQTRIQQGRQKAGQLFETSVAQQMPFEEDEDTGMPGLFGKGQMKQQYDVPEGIFAPAPGVRYV
jgi:hypothetical protein